MRSSRGGGGAAAFSDNNDAPKGQAAVLYDLPRVSEPCGTGLER